MMPVVPVSVAAVYATVLADEPEYAEAAKKIGLTAKQYAAFRHAIEEGDASYERLPRHIDAMAGVHRHRVYALHNVVIPAGIMGWEIPVGGGVTVIVPQVCGNLSMNQGPKPKAPIAYRNFPVPHPRKSAPPIVVVIPPTAPVPVPESSPTPAPVIASTHRSALPFFAPLFPIAAAIVGSNGPSVPPCSEGSNSMGVCRR